MVVAGGGYLDVTGGEVYSGNSFYVGRDSDGTMSVEDGGLVTTGHAYVGDNNAEADTAGGRPLGEIPSPPDPLGPCPTHPEEKRGGSGVPTARPCAPRGGGPSATFGTGSDRRAPPESPFKPLAAPEPRPSKREELARQGVTVAAAARSNWRVQNSAEDEALLKEWRGQVERRIGLFDQQFHADRTRCRSRRHYEARRWTKVLSHNLSRHLNGTLRRPRESLAHFRLVA